MAPFGGENHYGEPGYDYGEINLEDFMELGSGEEDEDGGMPPLEVHIGSIKCLVREGEA